MLAYSAHFDGESVIPAWASGTGFSGLIGFAAMIACTEAGFDHRVVLLFALIIPVGFALVFFCILDPSRRRKALNDEAKRQPGGAEVLEVKEKGTDQSYTLPKEEMTTEEAETVSGGGLQSQRAGIATTAATTARSVEKTEVEGGGLKPNERCKSTEDGEGPLSFSRKVALFFSLWPWIFPYFLTFFAKYASMDGPWAAMGFPVTEERARKEFYLWALLCFQVGVVIARTFGNSLHWTPFRVWMIPLCQVGLLIGYVAIAGTPPVMTSDGALGWVLLVPAFLTGVLGGLIYIGIYLLVIHGCINKHPSPHSGDGGAEICPVQRRKSVALLPTERHLLSTNFNLYLLNPAEEFREVTLNIPASDGDFSLKIKRVKEVTAGAPGDGDDVRNLLQTVVNQAAREAGLLEFEGGTKGGRFAVLDRKPPRTEERGQPAAERYPVSENPSASSSSSTKQQQPEEISDPGIPSPPSSVSPGALASVPESRRSDVTFPDSGKRMQSTSPSRRASERGRKAGREKNCKIARR
uniref:Uncharacterized protein n=1 Tax=Chromera velia CCMP2878 TaxID=1169474 RepID=A0A0G4F802_9ALVE|eukprot:Cvel_15699.t1-p1 / transcript=Cvel_15699.t1 / gene=Cvel_15699 / organism=Chromera_velia_CCMP2878 / gene_product=hypothetical protein / transcript_product=hypothetical protein / location=Cvel_scaffold1172:7917-12907(+) / protein_length=522 / sequence_SO=supercontig / SO=protein_coding / is_pseudo=false